MFRHPRLHLRAILGIAVLCAAMLALLGAPGHASAGFGTCRGDPIITLSDGTQVTLTADIGLDVSRVHELQFTPHGPRGTHVTAIRYPDPFGAPETVDYAADAPPGVLWADTRANTSGRADMTV